MKIVLSVPGNSNTVTMARYVPKALKQLGHDVIVFNYHYDNLFERLYKKMSFTKLNAYKNRELVKLIEKEQPDFFFSIYGEIHNAELIRSIKSKGIKTACWWLNDPFHLPFAVNNASPEYDFFFSNSRGTQPDYKKNGVETIHFLPVGIDPDLHRDLNLPKTKHDVVFMGDHHSIRETMIEDLIKKDINVAIYGPWKRKIAPNSILRPHLVHNQFFTPEQMVEVFNQSKIVLNFHTWIDRWNYGINPRLFEAAACGSFQIVDFKQEIPEFFSNGSDIVWFKDKQEIPELIHHYLNNDHERNSIAGASFKTSSAHTYEKRMKELLDVCGF